MANKTSIERTKLEGFISRYFLGGIGKSVVWNYDGKKLTTEFAAEARTMKGTVSLNTLSYPEEFKLGIYETEKLFKLIAILNESCDLKVTTVDEEAKFINLDDGNYNVKFVLSPIDMIPPAPKSKELPKMDVGIKLTKEFMGGFVGGINALPDVTTFTFGVDKGKAKFTIGYTSIASSNSITIESDMDYAKPISQLVFPSNVFKEIFSANKDSKEMYLEFSEKGLAKLQFDSDDYNATYYVINTEEAR